MGVLQKNGAATCDDCGRTCDRLTNVYEAFSATIAFGPGGNTEMFVHQDDAVQCVNCADSRYTPDA